MKHDAAPELAPPPAPDEPPGPTTRLMALEAMLFASPAPVKVTELVEATGWDKPMVERDLDQLAEVLHGRGAYRDKWPACSDQMFVPERDQLFGHHLSQRRSAPLRAHQQVMRRRERGDPCPDLGLELFDRD